MNSVSRWYFLFLATLLIGIVSGIGGMFLATILHFIQHLAYGYRLFPVISHENFLNEVMLSHPSRRVAVVLLCGFIAGFGWWAVFRYGKPLVSIANAIKSPRPYMPIGTTLVHVFLQIITVALGSPLGREVAPREFSAVFACWLTNKMKLRPKESQILVACAAGAGLAAVYNVPFGGTMFTLEVLLGSFHWAAVVPAMTTAVLAVVISWVGLGNQLFYHLPTMTLDYSMIIWSIITGPIFGFFAYWFKEITNKAQSTAPRNWRIIVFCLINFCGIGLLSIYFPALLGNGKSAAQLGFDGSILTLEMALILFILRVLIVFTSVQAGAWGGLLTPSLANGALMAVVMGILWSDLWPGNSISAFAVIGGAAFLAAAQKMPITAIILVIEFTGINLSFFIPILLAIAGSISMFNLCAYRRKLALTLGKQMTIRSDS